MSASYLGSSGVDLCPRTLDTLERIVYVLSAAVELLKGEPGIPDHLRPIEVLRCDVLEDFARIIVQAFLARVRSSIQNFVFADG